MSFTSGATYGKYKHTLTVNEMPAHRHGTNVLQFDTGNRNQNGGGTNATFGDTASAGGGQAHRRLRRAGAPLRHGGELPGRGVPPLLRGLHRPGDRPPAGQKRQHRLHAAEPLPGNAPGSPGR